MYSVHVCPCIFSTLYSHVHVHVDVDVDVDVDEYMLAVGCNLKFTQCTCTVGPYVITNLISLTHPGYFLNLSREY